MKLTVKQIKAATEGARLQDGGGLYFERTKTGGRWVFRFQLNGKRRDMGLGTFPQLTLAQARDARAKWSAVAKSGIDPIVERQKRRDAAAAAQAVLDPTFEDMVNETFEAKKDSLKNEACQDRWMSPLKIHVLPKLGSKRIAEIHQRDIHDALAPIWRTKHETADKALYRSRMAFQHARLKGYNVDPMICDAARQTLGFVDHEEVPIASTPWTEVPTLFEHLGEKDHPSYLALRFAILTVARGTPIRNARFDEIEGDVWTIPEANVKGLKRKVRDFRIPLSTAALDVVEACHSNRMCDYLFPSPRTLKGVSDVAMTKVLNNLNESGRTHGFRTSFRTWVQDTDPESWHAAETALGHVVGNKVERSYARSDLLDQRRILMQKWGEFVTQESAKVVRLRG